MSRRNPGLTADPLFVAATRPPMRWGVTYSALLFNLVFTMEVFLATRNLLALLLALPIHAVAALLCASDARFFDLLLLAARTRLPAALGNLRFWHASSYSPLILEMPGRKRVRRRAREAWIELDSGTDRPRRDPGVRGHGESRREGREERCEQSRPCSA